MDKRNEEEVEKNKAVSSGLDWNSLFSVGSANKGKIDS